MQHVIILRGPLGVGKSTIAKALAQKLNGECISIDRVLEELALDTSDGDGISSANFIAANEHVLPQIQEHIKKSSIIIDGNFYHREQIEHFEKHLPSMCKIFTLKAPVDICIERDRGRDRRYGEDATRAVHNLVARFDYGTTVNTEGKTAQEVVKEIVTQLL